MDSLRPASTAVAAPPAATYRPRSVAGGLVRSGVWSTAIPLCTYALLVLAIWAPGARYRGLNYETTLVYDSQTRGVLEGFLWASDPLRMFTSVFYHLSYLLSVATGNSGDYIFYQYVYAALWFGRGVLVFAIARRLLPSQPLAAFLLGGLTIVHASDGAINWVGQLNQFGFMFWLALAGLFLAVAITSSRWYARLGAIVLAGAAEFLCLWSYESPLPLVVALPLLFFLIVRPRLHSTWWLVPLWYVVPGVYIGMTLSRYLDPAAGASYQESVVSKSFSIAGALRDWLTHMTYSLQFWRWNLATPDSGTEGVALVSGLLAAAAFVGFGVIYALLPGPRQRADARAEPSQYPEHSLNERDDGADKFSRPPWPRPVASLLLLLIALAVLALSFPVYLLLDGNTNMWRTQMLSGFGAASVFTAVILLLVSVLRVQRVQAIAAVACASVIVFFGTQAGVRAGGFHESGWEKHRAFMSQVVHLVPDVSGSAFILVVDVPKDQDPFGDAMWFDFPVRLSYPSHETGGGLEYLASDNADNRWRFDNNGIHWNGRGYPPPNDLHDVPYKQLILVDDHPDGQLSVLPQLPPELWAGPHASDYEPSKIIVAGAVQPANERRFGY